LNVEIETKQTPVLARKLYQNNKAIMPRSFLILPLLSLILSSCFLSMHHKRKPALVRNADIDETLKISRDEMQKQNISQSLGLWVLRDQVVTPSQAHMISELYLTHIDSMKNDFNIWHSSWAVANLYRFGDDGVKAELETAYQKAKLQPVRIQKRSTRKIANSHINGKRMVTGFIHAGGRSYAKRHLVVPGNKRYVQSYEDYRQKEKK
jgi:hypothetical protein